MQHLDDAIIKIGCGFSRPASNHPGDDQVGHLRDHNAENDKNKGLKARICSQVPEYTELVQESL
jgi:hypothetical protein